MLMEWLEPTIRDRIKTVIENAEKDNRIFNARLQYSECFKELQYSVPQELQDSLKAVDQTNHNLFKIAMELAYKSGFRDALEFRDLIQK